MAKYLPFNKNSKIFHKDYNYNPKFYVIFSSLLTFKISFACKGKKKNASIMNLKVVLKSYGKICINLPTSPVINKIGKKQK